ncbi:hypothetical protein Ahy_B05g076256 [Arachis hypogaea]|uniref:Protein FAR1-RELATED SEQUENCE n=1 Tax=Arachis hypogaea TaxID=3818 RepID=A0A444Z2W7_ARAHY|nr:hypothetical protein Ahy_B05g076256 [Arachis hypogaea]
MEFKISPTLKANLSAGINCPARIYVHILTDVGLWIISKVVLNHSHPCCPDRADMLKQHRELSMFVRRTIENNEEALIRLSKTYKSFVAAGDAFDRNWSNLLKKYGVGGNKWLSEFVELIEILHQTFDNVMAEMQEYQVKSKSKCSLSHEDATLNDVNDLQSPPRVRTRERPKNRLG